MILGNGAKWNLRKDYEKSKLLQNFSNKTFVHKAIVYITFQKIVTHSLTHTHAHTQACTHI